MLVHCMDTLYFAHSPIGGHLGYFQLLAIVKNTAVKLYSFMLLSVKLLKATFLLL